ncbi:MAG: hypothetical protein ABL955_10855, partial [Elusimicrobiota bacterium]
MKKLLAPGALILALALSASAAPDAIFDGSRLFGAGVAVPVYGSYRKASSILPRPSAPALAEPAAPAQAPAESVRRLTSGFLGLYPEADFDFGTGRCVACNAPVQGKWYFPDDVIA